MSQNQQNIQNYHLAWAAAQPRRRRKAADWQAFHNQVQRFCRVLQVFDKKSREMKPSEINQPLSERQQKVVNTLLGLGIDFDIKFHPPLGTRRSRCTIGNRRKV